MKSATDWIAEDSGHFDHECADCVRIIREIQADAAADMRERAAKMCEDSFWQKATFWLAKHDSEASAAAIRALPVEAK